jgi:hypothetical protein
MIRCLNNLPHLIDPKVKAYLMKKSFGIEQEEFTKLNNTINNEYDISFEELLQSFS